MNSPFNVLSRRLPRWLLGWLLVTQLGIAFCLFLWTVLVALAIRAWRAGDAEIPFPLAGLVAAAAFPVSAAGCSFLAWRLARGGQRALPALVAFLPLAPALVYAAWVQFVAD